MEKYVNLSAVCPLASCTMSGKCIRYLGYQKVLATETSYTVLNTRLFSPTENSCPYQLVEKKVRVAYGFKRLCGTVPSRNQKLLWAGSGFGSESTYYRYRRGMFGLSPVQQKKVLRYLEENGADISVGFDRYQIETVYEKP